MTNISGMGSSLENGHFNVDVSGLDVPYGILEHTIDVDFIEPGGGVATTNDSSGSLDSELSFGQCIDVKKLIKYSEKQGLDPTLELDAALKSGPRITEITIDGIFADDSAAVQTMWEIWNASGWKISWNG